MTTVPPPSGADPGFDPVAELTNEVSAGGGERLASTVHLLRRAVWAISAAASLTGMVALALGLGAWGGSPLGIVLVLVATLPAIAAPIYVARRTSAMAHAAANPRGMALQAKDLLSGLRSSPELVSLVTRLRRRGRDTATTGGRGRLRRGVTLLRLTSAVVGQASPDPKRHPLLVPFQPDRLRATWLAVIVSLWAWLAASVVAMLAAVVLLANAL